MNDSTKQSPWYSGITRYQWIVLLIASLGWVFDIFEGQVFIATKNVVTPALVRMEYPDASKDDVESWAKQYDNYTLAAFLAGGALGGIFFGMLSDRIGRKQTMVITILIYSAFTALSAIAQTWWQMAILRFLVAMGVGGEWAVASAMVAEVFPPKARAWSLGIFHASSVLGTYLGVFAKTIFVDTGWFVSESMPSLPWRLCYLVGVLPALLTIWIRASLKEPESWEKVKKESDEGTGKKVGNLGELFSQQLWLRTVVGVGLAAVGLATFWGAHVNGKDRLMRTVKNEYLVAAGVSQDAAKAEKDAVLEQHEQSTNRWDSLGMFLVTSGGGLGLICFGPLAERIGRRGTFLFYHIGALVISLYVFTQTIPSTILAVLLPLFGFLTLGMHAGYAIYFPELYPTRIRGTGAGFCFNAGRIIAAPILILKAYMLSTVDKGGWGYSPDGAAATLCLLFAGAFIMLLFAPETKGQPLPE
ncbi:MAG: MFS transporter [Planctomycetaceae bacterium]|nr:MFS transporter [Planctomycetaceae bacterium]MCB9950311.1 MFS transporter [Planctomycetaceae bacterium]